MLILKLRSRQCLKPAILSAAVLLLLCIALFFWQLNGYSLFNITEAKQAEIARQISVRNNWITPIYNGEIYFDKPVLLHWFIALGFAAIGINEWAVRLPSAISAMALILITWLFVARFAYPRTAFIAATILAANVFTFALGRTGQHDMLMTCFMTAALYCWYWAYSTGQIRGYLLFCGLLALAVFVKGPLALALCVLIITVFLIWVNKWKEQLTTFPWVLGIIIFGGITLPWYALMLRENGWTFINNFFFFNNVDRFLSPNLNQVGPWYYYLPLVLISFFPWIVLIPQTLAQRFEWRSLRFDSWRQRTPQQQINLFMTIWFMVVLIFMSIAATKLPWYVYPGFPALAYLCAQAWDRQIAAPDRWLQLSLRAISVVYALLAVGFVAVPQILSSDPVVTSINSTGILWVWAVTYLIAAIATWFSSINRQAVLAGTVSVIAFSVFALTFVTQLMPVLDGQISGRRLLPIAQVLRQKTCNTCPTSLPVALGVNEPSLNFYSRLSYIQRFDEPYQPANIRDQLRRSQPILLVTTDAALEAARLDLGEFQPVYRSDIYKLFVIPPNSDIALAD